MAGVLDAAVPAPAAGLLWRRCADTDTCRPEAPDGWLGLDDAAKALGVARQTVLHKVQRGELANRMGRTARCLL